MVNTTYNSTEDIINKLQQLKGKTKLKFFRNINNYYTEMKNKNFQTKQDPFAKNAQSISKIYHEVFLLMNFSQTKPQIKNMNINYYELYNNAIKSRKEIVDDNENEYISFNDIITPNHYIRIEPRETILRQVEKFEILNKSFQVILTTKMEMIINNENKKLSRNTKRRINRKNKSNDDMKLILNKIKSEKKKKYKNFDKIKQLEILLVRIKYAGKPDKLESALKELNKNQVIDKNLHEIKNEILLDYAGAFETVGNLKVGDQIRQTNIRFRNMASLEAYINAIDEGYDAEDAIFSGFFYKLKTPQFNKVNRSQYGNGCDFEHETVKYRGINCFIPTKGYCFVKCLNYLSGQDYKQEYLDFIGNEKRRSNIMTKARIQPFCKANNIDLGYYNDDRVFPRSVTNRDRALYLYNNHFCFIWKSENVSFKQAIKELKDNFKVVDNFITEENVKSHFEYIYKQKNIESHLTIFITYDLETHNTDRARPNVFCIYRLSK